MTFDELIDQIDRHAIVVDGRKPHIHVSRIPYWEVHVVGVKATAYPVQKSDRYEVRHYETKAGTSATIHVFGTEGEPGTAVLTAVLEILRTEQESLA